MSTTFICHHCHGRHRKNPRLKTPQRYCSAKACQQARKNKWEREKLEKDPAYKAKRRKDKKKWYSQQPGDKYQSGYRETHALYCEENRVRQATRNSKSRLSPQPAKIVKTDTLTRESLTPEGLYILLPYENTDAKKIVKTDALIVQMLVSSEIAGYFLQDRG